MKHWIYIFAVPFALAGCMTKGAPIGASAGLNPAAPPIEAGGMAGPEMGGSSASGTSGSGAGGGETDGGAGIGGEPSDRGGPSDPTAGNDSPITIVGTPMGGSRKPKPCPRDFRLCFHDVTVTANPDGTDGLLQYDISGVLGTQQTAGATIEGVSLTFIYLIDLLFPDNEHTTATGKPPLGDFVATVVSPPGRGLRFQVEFCKRTTTLDVILPDLMSSPLTVDPCGGTEPTDVGPSEGPLKFREDFDFGRQFKAQ